MEDWRWTCKANRNKSFPVASVNEEGCTLADEWICRPNYALVGSGIMIKTRGQDATNEN